MAQRKVVWGPCTMARVLEDDLPIISSPRDLPLLISHHHPQTLKKCGFSSMAPDTPTFVASRCVRHEKRRAAVVVSVIRTVRVIRTPGCTHAISLVV